MISDLLSSQSNRFYREKNPTASRNGNGTTIRHGNETRLGFFRRFFQALFSHSFLAKQVVFFSGKEPMIFFPSSFLRVVCFQTFLFDLDRDKSGDRGFVATAFTSMVVTKYVNSFFCCFLHFRLRRLCSLLLKLLSSSRLFV